MSSFTPCLTCLDKLTVAGQCWILTSFRLVKVINSSLMLALDLNKGNKKRELGSPLGVFHFFRPILPIFPGIPLVPHLQFERRCPGILEIHNRGYASYYVFAFSFSQFVFPFYQRPDQMIYTYCLSRLWQRS